MVAQAAQAVFQDPASAETDPVIVPGTNSKYLGIVVTIEDIGLEEAEAFLEVNIDNRRVKKRQVQAIFEDLIAGDWNIDGSPFKYDKLGRGFDGQHRAEAIRRYWAAMLAAGLVPQAVPSVIVRGLPVQARGTTDTNATRSAGDNAIMQKLPYAQLQVAIAKWVIAWQRGEGVSGGGAKPTNSQVSAMIAALNKPERGEQALEEIAKWSQDIAGRYRGEVPKLTPAITGAALWLFGHVDESGATARFFLKNIWSAANIDEASPEMTFRRRLVRADKTAEKMDTIDVWIFLLNSWNKFQGGKETLRLQRPTGRKHAAADIPRVHGAPERGGQPYKVGTSKNRRREVPIGSPFRVIADSPEE